MFATDDAATTVPAVTIDDQPTARIATKTVDRTARRRRSWRIVLFLAGSVAIGLVVGSVWSLTRDDDASREPNPPPVTTTPQPELPSPLEGPFERLEEAVRP